jgi:hypothetical protein
MGRVRDPLRNATRRGKREHIEQALATGEHIVLIWFDRIYSGHIIEADEEGFRLAVPDDTGLWSGWDAKCRVEQPWWDVTERVCYGDCHHCARLHPG